MKNLFIVFIFATSSLFANTWNIIDKSMNPYHLNGETTVNMAWGSIQGSSAGSICSQEEGYVNFSKMNTGASGRWAWVRPVSALTEIKNDTPYSMEIKARIREIDKNTHPNSASDFEANQISIRIGSKGIAAPIFLKYGNSDNGSINTAPSGGSAPYTINTSEWQIYRIVLNANHSKYDVYVKGIDNPIYENISVISTSDQNGVYFGAESRHRCNIDVEYVRMGEGDFYSKAKFTSLYLSSNSHLEYTQKTITATAKMSLINDGESVIFRLLDNNNTIVYSTESTVTNSTAIASITLPSSLPKGIYTLEAAVPNNATGNIPVRPIASKYLVCYSNKLPSWALGGFVRPDGKNPVIEPIVNSEFFCPMTQSIVRWEESDTFNPGAVVKDGKICVLYRAEDNSAVGIGKRVSRVALAETTDGVTMKRFPEPIFYPDNDNLSKTYEWSGGCEDPRVAVTEEGLYVLFYTGWNRKTARLCVATSTDLKKWTRHGPIFTKAYGGKYLDTWTKSSSIVTEIKNDEQVVAQMNVNYNGKTWKYFMYWGEARTYAAVSDDLVNWTPLEDSSGELLVLAPTRRGYFDSSLVECGPPAVITDKGIVMMYNGRNSTNADADPRFNKGTYSAGQMLFDRNDPCKLLGRTDVPFFHPTESFEKSGQYATGTVFIEGLVYYKKKWFLYYGCADSKVGVAIYDPAVKTDGDPIPPHAKGKGIASYPPNGIGSKNARIHSCSGHTQESEGAFNLLYSYFNARKWCDNQNPNPWVVIELNGHYSLNKTVIHDVAPYENGNGNVPEYWIYTSNTGTAASDWKEIVHKTEQQNVNVKEDIYTTPEDARYIKLVLSRGTRTDNGNPENATRIYGFDIHASLSRPIDRGDIVSVGKTVMAFNQATDYFSQPLHLLDGDASSSFNRWSFNQSSDDTRPKYAIFDLKSEYQIEKFALYDSRSLDTSSSNIDAYSIYLSTSAPDMSLTSPQADNNTIWTKVVDTKGQASQNIKINTIQPTTARYIKLEIPHSNASSTVNLYEFEVYKTPSSANIESTPLNDFRITPNVLRANQPITVLNSHAGMLSLFNMQGVKLMEQTLHAGRTVIPLHVPTGTYIVELKSNASRKATKLIVT